MTRDEFAHALGLIFAQDIPAILWAFYQLSDRLHSIPEEVMEALSIGQLDIMHRAGKQILMCCVFLEDNRELWEPQPTEDMDHAPEG